MTWSQRTWRARHGAFPALILPALRPDGTFGKLAASVLLWGFASRASGPAAGAEGRTFRSNGIPIYYTVEGTGPPVVLIHGLTASGDLNWRLPGIIASLSPDYRVITMDVRGHGRSGNPDGESAYGVELVEDVARLLDHLRIRKAHVAGYSMGGMITMKLLTRHPDRVTSAALGGMGWLKEGSPLQAFWGRIPRRGKGRLASDCARSLGRLAVTEKEVRAVRTPTAILVGEQDPVRNLYVAPLMRIRRDWPVTVIPGAGHMDCPARAEFRDGLKRWLGRQRRDVRQSPDTSACCAGADVQP